MKNRYIGENIRIIQECIDYLNDEDKPGLIFFADFEKAFDSVSHDFIYQCLRKFNFGDTLIKWVKLFYTNINSIVINNGHLTSSISVERGVWQGCPLSTSIFLLCIEILAQYIETTDTIKGVRIDDEEIKQSLFADDATYLLDGSENCFKPLIYILTEFGKLSGLRLNRSKSVILRVGSFKEHKIQFCKNIPFIWTSDYAKTLGIVFSNDHNINLQQNITPKLQEFKHVLKQWHHRKLTLLGKVTVIKTFALPK